MFTKLVENVFSPEECDKIIEFGKKLNLKYVSTYYTKTNENLIDTSFNKRKADGFNPDDLSETIKFSQNILHILNDLKLYDNVKYDKIPFVLFNEYEQTNFLNYHSDDQEISIGATLTILLQLNDDYEGGEFCYLIDGNEYVVPKLKGSIFIFESIIKHKVNIVTNGIRYSLNAWPSFTKTKKLF